VGTDLFVEKLKSSVSEKGHLNGAGRPIPGILFARMPHFLAGIGRAGAIGEAR
jgi:hypothetical protein